MDFNQFHLAYPSILWIFLLIPLAWGFFFIFYQKHPPHHQLENFIDTHLLPYLLVNNTNKSRVLWKSLLLWSVVWVCLTIALAGPRWSFREIETFSKDQTLVILLDLSESMNAKDAKPSRLIRAKQKIEDLLKRAKGVKIGLIAFAADPHMITPITEDKETILHMLPSISTDLIYIQGSRLSNALEMASNMLEAEPGSNKAIVVVSDGGIEDENVIPKAKQLANKGITIHTIGVGTFEGIPLTDKEGNVVKINGSSVLSRLEKEKLEEISKIGKGHYFEAHYSNLNETTILSELEEKAQAIEKIGTKNRFWDEHFYLMIFPALPIILWWFRRGYLFAFFLIFFIPTFELKAFELNQYFQNSEEQGKQALENGENNKASTIFQDPYRKGVAYYRAGDFAEAEKMFRQSSREEVACDAQLNLGNSLAQQQKLKEAIATYEALLERWPEHIKAKENLEILKKMLEEEQKQDSQNQENSDKQEQQNSNSENDQKNENQDSSNSDEKKESKDNKSQQQSEESQQQQKENNETSSQNDNKNDSQDPQDRSEKEKQEKEERGNRSKKENNQSINEVEEKELSEIKTSENDEKAQALKKEIDQDADLWLNRIENDPKDFLKKKFIIESRRNKTVEESKPW
jgi:Ca-activated chloride channel homolog